MSFVGQFGPTFIANRGLRRITDSGVYVLGVLFSSAISVLALHAAGGWFRRTVGDQSSTIAALTLATLLLGADAVRVWAGRSTSLGPQRQTPYAWRLKGPLGVLGWGLDTGLPVSTVRVTPLPALGMILVATGHASPIHGFLYGLGVTLGLLASLAATTPDSRTDQVMQRIHTRRCEELRPTRLVLLPGCLTVVALTLALALPQ